MKKRVPPSIEPICPLLARMPLLLLHCAYRMQGPVAPFAEQLRASATEGEGTAPRIVFGRFGFGAHQKRNLLSMAYSSASALLWVSGSYSKIRSS
jgi:hypothetical protein